MSEQAFAGLKVFDASQGVAGPHATMLMALHGADVVKVEPIDGDWGRVLGRRVDQETIHFRAFNAALGRDRPEVAVRHRRGAADGGGGGHRRRELPPRRDGEAGPGP